jgi:uncharacterized protein (TIGR02231 family)
LPAGTSRVGGSPARVFTAGSRATISSDGHEHRVEVHREESAAELVHEAVPRESKDVWRLCRVRPTSALPSGPVQVFEDDAFVVAGNVSGSAGAVLRFNLGVDPDVKIESRAPHVHQAEKGLMGGTTHVEHKVTTVVRSTRKEPVELTIYDRLPVPGADVKDVTVTLGECAPPLSVTDRSPDGGVVKGGFKVSVRLMPGEKRTLEHAYTITLPAKLEVVGGNRRE